ncbi:MAG: c-type cytochrome [Betaproteobacteria bacterium]|nr:c-type cytochrome [Betaproteobacteria bacterium]
MIEVVGTVARLAQTLCGCALVGSMLFVYQRSTLPVAPQKSRRHWVIWALGFLLAGVVALAVQGVSASGESSALLDGALLWRLLSETRFGLVWWMRQGWMLAVLALAWRIPMRWLPAVAVFAALATALGAASGHAAALEPAWPAVSALILHLGAIALWWGGLWPLARTLAAAADVAALRAELQRFSRLASGATVIILATGTYLAVTHVDRWPALFGTRYGQLLLSKLMFVALVLGCAARLRWHWMRVVHDTTMTAVQSAVRRVLAWEYGAACVVIILATLIADTPPARHEQVQWPFVFRFAPDVALSQPDNLVWVYWGAAAWLIALALAVLSLRLLPLDIVGSAAVGLTFLGGALTLPALTVPAYPVTYHASAVPYDAISIASGSALFQQHCAGCHGAGGLGDGPLAAGLAKAPADLSAPHTADHTAGDMFWWLTHGMAGGVMPGFDASLGAEARWDLINYLRAFSSGYQARILRPRVAAGQPWLGAPDFSYSTQQGDSGALRALRFQRPTLLVFYTLPYSEARLHALARQHLPARAVQVLAVGIDAATRASTPALDLPVVTQGAEETALAYLLLRRTLRHVDAGDRGPLPAHMEVLIDRFGYVRGRWLPEESGDWLNIAVLRQQIEALSAEPEILPPPDEHIH